MAAAGAEREANPNRLTGSGERGVSSEASRSAPQEHFLLRTAARGDPGYAPHLDRDNNGIAYE